MQSIGDLMNYLINSIIFLCFRVGFSSQTLFNNYLLLKGMIVNIQIALILFCKSRLDADRQTSNHRSNILPVLSRFSWINVDKCNRIKNFFQFP